MNRIYQDKIAIGSKGFPFNYNKDVQYVYEKGLCPVAERLHEKELMYSPLVREPLTVEDMKDFADAFEKVVENMDDLRKNSVREETGIFDAVAAINETSEKA
jgi:hypothetical protein